MPEFVISHGGYELAASPEDGGAISRFEWQREPLFRARTQPGPLSSACFPLAPFSNRIRLGEFCVNGRRIRIAPNFPGSDHPHPLHGFAWLNPWTVRQHDSRLLEMSYLHQPGEWPWRFEVAQTLVLSDKLYVSIAITNLSDEPMPSGLGLHPYFPRSEQTIFKSRHCGEWRTGVDGLPIELQRGASPRDYWQERPVGTRNVDTVYTGRQGPLEIAWPERRLRLQVSPSANLPFTVVYTPADADFFCVEPVSHETDAVNGREGSGLVWLEPGQHMSATVRFSAERIEELVG